MVQLALMEIGRCFQRQSELFNVVVLSRCAVCQPQQKVRRNLEVVRDGDNVFAGQLIRLFGHKAAERVFADAQSLRQLGLRDRLAPAQIADSVPQRPRQPFSCINPSSKDTLLIASYQTCPAKSNLLHFCNKKPVLTPMG